MFKATKWCGILEKQKETYEGMLKRTEKEKNCNGFCESICNMNLGGLSKISAVGFKNGLKSPKYTNLLSEIQQDESNLLMETQSFLEEMGVKKPMEHNNKRIESSNIIGRNLNRRMFS